MTTNVAIRKAAPVVQTGKGAQKPAVSAAEPAGRPSDFAKKFDRTNKKPQEPETRERTQTDPADPTADPGVAAGVNTPDFQVAVSGQPGSARPLQAPGPEKVMERSVKTDGGAQILMARKGPVKNPARPAEMMASTALPDQDMEQSSAPQRKDVSGDDVTSPDGVGAGKDRAPPQPQPGSAASAVLQQSGMRPAPDTEDSDDPQRLEIPGGLKSEGDQPTFASRSTGHLSSAAPAHGRGGDNVALVRSVSSQLAGAASQNEALTEVTLDPAELGKVRMTLHTTERGITVHFNADRPETIDLLRRNTGMLESEFQSLGHADVGFSFSRGDGDTTPDGPKDGDSTLTLPDNTEIRATISPSARVVALGGSGTLDLRL